MQRPRQDGRQRQRDQRRRDALAPARQEHQHRERDQPNEQLGAARRVARLQIGPNPLEEMVGRVRRSETKQILDLQHADHRADARGEPGRHRMGDELDEPPQPEETHRQQQDTCHAARHQEPGESLADQDGREDDDERRRGPADLEARSAQKRHRDARHDGGIEPVLRRYAHGDGQRHRERQRHDAHHQACERIVAEMGRRVALGEDCPERGAGNLAERGRLRVGVPRASHLRRGLRNGGADERHLGPSGNSPAVLMSILAGVRVSFAAAHHLA
jgi:hypothetical protein